MFETLAETLSTGLKLWLSKEKTKYVDKLISLRKEYYVEINRPFSVRDNARLDNLEFELRTLAIAFNSVAGKPDAGSGS